MTPEQEKAVTAAPALYRGILRRAYEGTPSRTNAIRAKCLDCCHHLRDEVRHCTVTICPLWHYRPYQQGEGDDK